MISIVIPLYNKGQSIRSTLESIFRQTFRDYEIVIVNDGSTDNSVEVINEIKDDRVRVIHQKNQGVSVARNKGIEEAKYNYIALLDADDTWLPTYLTAQVNLINTYPECKVYACAYSLCDSKGNISDIILNKMPFKENTGILSNYFEVASCSHPPISASSVVIEKGAINDVKGFPIGIKAGEDLLTWAYLAAKYKIAFDRQSLAVFNFPENVRMREPRLVEKDVVFLKLRDLYHASPNDQKRDISTYIGRWNEMRTVIFIDSNKRTKALLPLWRMIRYKGINLKGLFLFTQLLLPSGIRNLLFSKLKQKYHSRKNPSNKEI